MSDAQHPEKGAMNNELLRPQTQEEKLDEIFSYHAPTAGQPEKYEAIRKAARSMAATVLANCPPSADRTAALRKVREAMMTANASVALDGLGF